MTTDFKAGPRRRDPDLMRLLHLDPGPCSVCGASYPMMHLHHIVPRGRGGDDSRENLSWLCPHHHRDLHAYRLSEAQLASVIPISVDMELRVSYNDSHD